MLKSLSIGAAGMLAMLLAAPAGQAQDGPPPPMHPPSFDDLDTNHDGVISKDEFAAGQARMPDHMGPPPGGEGHWHHRHPPMDLKSLDSNGDGKVSFDEFTAPMKQHFDRMDANHDGTLDQSELAAPRDGGDGPPPSPPPAGGN